MGKLYFGNSLVVGKRNSKVNEVVQLVSEYFLKVKRVSECAENLESYPSDHFNLIVVTDYLDHESDKNLIANLRGKFPQAKMIGLFDDINQAIEINMRSVGLIFLGSYDLFSENSQNVFQSAFGSGKEIQEPVAGI